MAKRRNLKKEKAERNLAYARKYRKASGKNFGRGRRSFNGNSKKRDENKEETAAEQDN